MKYSKILVVAFMVLLLGACAKSSAVEIGEEAPGFALADIDGKTVSLSDFKGKVIILDFFASWCPPCRQEIPDFIDLQKAYAPQGFSVVGVSLVSPGESKDFASKMGINYPVLIDDEKVSVLYGPVRSIPMTFIINKEFRIMKKYIGPRPKDMFEADVKELLK